MTSLIHVANIRANKVANRRSINVAYEIRREYEASVHRDHYIQAFATASSRDLPAQLGNSGANSCSGKYRTALGVVASPSTSPHKIASSMITTRDCWCGARLRRPSNRGDGETRVGVVIIEEAIL